MWVRPGILSAWMTRATTVGYNRVHIVMHGTDARTYEAIRNDGIGFQMNRSATDTNMRGPGIYVGLTTRIPTLYNKTLPRGSGILCLLLMPTDVQAHSEQFEWCHYVNGDTMNDAVCVRDPVCLLPLGLAVAKAV